MIVLAVVVIINMTAIAYFTRQLHRLENKQKQELALLRKELRVFTGSMSEVGCHLIGVEQQLSDMGEKQSEIADSVQQESGETADYEQAKRLAEMGADIEELVSSCGLTHAEAELLERVQTRVSS